jgi:hypothetical protein
VHLSCQKLWKIQAIQYETTHTYQY